MTMLTSIRMVIRAATVGVLALVFAVGLAVAPAQARPQLKPTTINLEIRPANGYYTVNVWGNFRMTQEEAQQFIDSGGYVEITLKGQDTFSHDILLTYPAPHMYAGCCTDAGLWFVSSTPVAQAKLDEDLGEDEVYAGVLAIDSAGRLSGNGASTVIRRSF
jgi:hypothetical protein